MARSEFGADRLLHELSGLPPAKRYLVGFSGGADSTALLTALRELGSRSPALLTAIHFNHGLQEAADDWQAHCSRVCARLGISLRIERLKVERSKGRSPELAARQARYRVVRSLLEPEDIFLTAHQQNDLSETLMLNLLRGSGVDGLASIPAIRRLGRGWVARPLLSFSRNELEDYLRTASVEWIEDPSNRDSKLDRNYLRNEIFPLLSARWAGAPAALARTARHARELSETLAHDLEQRFGHCILDAHTLRYDALADLPWSLQALLIRHWVRDFGRLPPPRARLTEFLRQLGEAESASSMAEMRWDGWLIRRYRNRLWMYPESSLVTCPARTWDGRGELDLGGALGVLSGGQGKPSSPCLRIGAREPCRGMVLNAGGPHRPLKDLLRESGVPPWLRNAVPISYRGEEVVAVGDWLLSAELRDRLSESGGDFRWKPAHELLVKLRNDCHAFTIDRATTLG